jgi:predicted DCC family thiol-disulfide oxidoreductase YuxK
MIKYDQFRVLKFSPNQSVAGQKMAKEFEIDFQAIKTVIAIIEGKVYFKTDAIIEISKRLSGWPRIFSLLKFIPKPIRDFFYDIFAKYRYTIFGKKPHCMLPDLSVKDRFLL